MDRAKKALHYGVALSFAIGVVMFYISFYHGTVLAGIFSSDPAVVTAGADYLKTYAIDCLLTAIFFCYVGFYNGIGLTKFVMVQGIVGAFFVRVPVSFRCLQWCRRSSVSSAWSTYGKKKNKEFGCDFGRAFLFLQNGYNFPQWVYAKMELR